MPALLWRPNHRPTVIEFVLGRTSLTGVAAEVMRLLRDPRQAVVVQVVGFDYFDEHDVTAVSDLATWSPRVKVEGLELFADLLLPRARRIDIRGAAERALTHLESVSVVTAIVDGRPLDAQELDEALELATRSGREIVTVDLRHLAELSPAQVLTIAEASAELHRQGRSLMLVNSRSVVAEQLRHGGLSGSLRMTVEDFC